MAKLYISDWHYGHANVLKFDSRPFWNVDEMNAELVKRWQAAVKPGDIVYVLGDMFWKNGDAAAVLDSLPGQKFLVKGNHDMVSGAELRRRFVKIDEYMEVDDGGRRVVLCHYPIPFFKNHLYGAYHLYGHVHSTWEYGAAERMRLEIEARTEKPCNMYNVGAMMPWMDYTPRTLDEIIYMAEHYRKAVTYDDLS